MKSWIKQHPKASLIITVALILIFISPPGIEFLKFVVLTIGFILLGLVVIFAVFICAFYFLQVFFGIRIRWFFDFLEVIQMERMLQLMKKDHHKKRD